MRARRWQAGCLATGLLLAAACSDTSQGSAGNEASTQAEPAPESTQTTAAATTALPDDTTFVPAVVEYEPLPVRDGPRRETTHAVPHIQVDAVLVPEVDAELHRRAFDLPGVEERESELSLPGARSLWLADDVDLIRPEVLLSGREFGHIHPNGSLHLLLPVGRAVEVAETKWGELHPWVGREDFWDGMVMVYTPETLDEVDITMLLIVDAYNFVTGADIDPATGS